MERSDRRYSGSNVGSRCRQSVPYGVRCSVPCCYRKLINTRSYCYLPEVAYFLITAPPEVFYSSYTIAIYQGVTKGMLTFALGCISVWRCLVKEWIVFSVQFADVCVMSVCLRLVHGITPGLQLPPGGSGCPVPCLISATPHRKRPLRRANRNHAGTCYGTGPWHRYCNWNWTPSSTEVTPDHQERLQ